MPRASCELNSAKITDLLANLSSKAHSRRLDGIPALCHRPRLPGEAPFSTSACHCSSDETLKFDTSEHLITKLFHPRAKDVHERVYSHLEEFFNYRVPHRGPFGFNLFCHDDTIIIIVPVNLEGKLV